MTRACVLRIKLLVKELSSESLQNIEIYVISKNDGSIELIYWLFLLHPRTICVTRSSRE